MAVADQNTAVPQSQDGNGVGTGTGDRTRSEAELAAIYSWARQRVKLPEQAPLDSLRGQPPSLQPH